MRRDRWNARPAVQTYDVEWEDVNGDEHVLSGVRARTASDAQEQAFATLKQRADFARILSAELYP